MVKNITGQVPSCDLYQQENITHPVWIVSRLAGRLVINKSNFTSPDMLLNTESNNDYKIYQE